MDSTSDRHRAIRLQWKRFFVFSVCYFLCFTAFRGLRDLQSTLNSAEGAGLASLAILNVCCAVAGLLVPAVIRSKLGTKWSMVLGMSLFTLYTAGNYFTNAYLLIFTGTVLGIGAAFVWVSRGTYITAVAMELAAVNQRDPAADVALLHGIFFSVSRSSTVCGNVISSLVFQKGWQLMDHDEPFDLGFCGIHACGSSDIANSTGALVPPDQGSRNLLLSIYVGFGILAVVIAVVCLERVPPKASPDTDAGEVVSTSKELFHGMLSTLCLMRQPRMALLIPLLAFGGVDVAFTAGHFTKFFIGCTQGIQAVGFVGVSMYVTAVVISPVMGRLMKYTGRVPVFFAGAAVYLLLLLVMALWDPESGQLWHLFAMASGLGFPRATIPTIGSILLGLLFPDQKEAAFGNLCFWQSLGFAFISILGVTEAVCASHVIAVTVGALLTVLVLYSILEFRVHRDKRRPSERVQYVPAGTDMDSGGHKEGRLDTGLGETVNEMDQ
ncbi:protein unc-93 homolog A-like isoform X2 [Acanthaster planci]|nr:protein unc-93 homolog A-like isoform X2 [Acanthaster planci]XP_022089036.1 protein unc-93 homolog A-like isoform X2 [Acanthaster planci]XP_022089037.1 protein unc-93 homolog A-like isoform X2 [Acanthaster planci]XP_022089038.1 protein unc-93 homolog A-like isoform X2 [Acanthaster planci]XP_022089040.1 protein unc-93 homolog A-like isoform X2 [Acanthaster planci]XP_022089041.1 protein unc-93 homolog A-like isoform X2 [Acanthaster planci]